MCVTAPVRLMELPNPRFRSSQPDGIKRVNWVQTIPGKGWFVIRRLYSPLEFFFDKSW